MVDDEEKVVGIVTVSDIIHFLVLRWLVAMLILSFFYVHANKLYYNLHPSQPFNVTLVPSGHVSHLSPEIPGLHMHFPLICSQSDRTDPCGEQLQTGNKIF